MPISITDLKKSERAFRAEQQGHVLQVLGWLMLGMAGITVLWVWTGWRSGSWFWLWVTGAVAFLGLSSAGIGTRMRERGARNYAALSSMLRATLAPYPESEDVGRRA